MRIATSIVCLMVVGVGLVKGQTVNMNRPEDTPSTKVAHPPKQRASPAQLEEQAKELAELASSIPADVKRVNQGLLPKDTADKLKRIEELSKRLRNELVY
jgi:hypothetical protein